MHMFSFRVENIAPACTEKYIIEVSKILTAILLYNIHGTLGNANAVFRILHLPIRI